MGLPVGKLNGKYMNNDLLEINDKKFAPFLLASSFNNLIKFVRSYSKDGILYWQFSPKEKAQKLLNQFSTKTDPPIPAQDLFLAIEVFWKQVAEAKSGGLK